MVSVVGAYDSVDNGGQADGCGLHHGKRRETADPCGVASKVDDHVDTGDAADCGPPHD